MADQPDQYIVLTPTKRTPKVNCMKVEKVPKVNIDESKIQHMAGGRNQGLVVNKHITASDLEEGTPPHLQLEFKCFLVDNKTGQHVPESRILKFWFVPHTDYLDKVTGAYEFFKELVKPDNFPREYAGFIMKVMKLLNDPKYVQIHKIGLDVMQLEESEGPPLSPGITKEDKRPRHLIVQEQLLITLESAYPNILPVEDLARMLNVEESMVEEQLRLLISRDLIKEMEPGKFVRKVLDENTEVKIVKQMPQQAKGQRPTVAIITSKYNEKLAVDSMMTNKTTFVRYKTEGESNVYTIGDIGSHTVVSTKLPAIGRQRAAQISSGNTTTRLLGTFGEIEHVFLVGCAGGVPHYTDFYKHVRLGDVILATPNPKGYMYIFCEKVDHDKDQGQINYTLKSWAPVDDIIMKTANNLRDHWKGQPSDCPWYDYIEAGLKDLQGQEVEFNRPPPDSDRLYMNIGGNDVIEVGHPHTPDEVKLWHRDGQPVLRQGAIASGKPVVKDDGLRLDFAMRHGCVAFDTEFDQVLESIVGNRKDSFAFVRGVSDYLDGTKNITWQPYAALSAAAYMKTLIENLPNPGYSANN
jgi:nucleoside phosphorylase